ncbi:MAG: hypothetical protein N2037_06615 [Acidimicrobiales bacterium]|nr:hypothetical protein [Acidimicrobiales bacterium]
MRRALAALAAVLMVIAAVLIRSRLEDRERATGGTSDPNEKPTLVCVSELERICKDLAARTSDISVRTEDAATTLGTLSSPDFEPRTAKIDAWLAPRPLPGMVNDRRVRNGLSPSVDEPDQVLARTPIVIAIWDDRLEVLNKHCPSNTVAWRCIGDVSGQPWSSIGGPETWGDVRSALPGAQTASGMLAMAEAAASFFGRSDYASNDFADPAFVRWFEQLARTSEDTVGRSGVSPVMEMLSKGPAAVQIAAATEAEAGPAIASSARKDRLRLLYPSPLVTADLVMAPVIGSAAAPRIAKLLESKDVPAALAQSGWRVPGQTSPSGIRTSELLPDSNGAPRPGVLLALRDNWLEATR